MNVLLILACSKRKTDLPGLVPAVELYDGVAFRVIRKQRREARFPGHIHLAILSAKFGLISGSTLIHAYDSRMDLQRAIELRQQVHRSLHTLLSNNRYSEIYVDLGRIYLAALDGFVMPADLRVVFAKGRIGERLRGLTNWLSSHSTDEF